MNPRLLDILCCPLTHSPLRLLGANEQAALKRAIASGSVVNAMGRTLESAPQAGLITVTGRTIYPIQDDIPIMLADESISAEQIPGLGPAGQA